MTDYAVEVHCPNIYDGAEIHTVQAKDDAEAQGLTNAMVTILRKTFDEDTTATVLGPWQPSIYQVPYSVSL